MFFSTESEGNIEGIGPSTPTKGGVARGLRAIYPGSERGEDCKEELAQILRRARLRKSRRKQGSEDLRVWRPPFLFGQGPGRWRRGRVVVLTHV